MIHLLKNNDLGYIFTFRLLCFPSDENATDAVPLRTSQASMNILEDVPLPFPSYTFENDAENRTYLVKIDKKRKKIRRKR